MDVTIQNDYPWSHLFQEINSELPIDQQELVAIHQNTQTELAKQLQIAQLQSQTIQQQREKLAEMQMISTKTFDKLDTKVKEITTDNKALTEQIKTLIVEKEGLSAQVDGRLIEIEALEKKIAIFDQIHSLSNQRNKELQELLANATEELQKHHDDSYSEITYQIVINQIMQHKAGVAGEESRQKTFQNIISWLHQRKNVVRYLRRHKIQAKMADELENILFIDEKTLNELMARVAF